MSPVKGKLVVFENVFTAEEVLRPIFALYSIFLVLAGFETLPCLDGGGCPKKVQERIARLVEYGNRTFEEFTSFV